MVLSLVISFDLTISNLLNSVGREERRGEGEGEEEGEGESIIKTY